MSAFILRAPFETDRDSLLDVANDLADYVEHHEGELLVAFRKKKQRSNVITMILHRVKAKWDRDQCASFRSLENGYFTCAIDVEAQIPFEIYPPSRNMKKRQLHKQNRLLNKTATAWLYAFRTVRKTLKVGSTVQFRRRLMNYAGDNLPSGVIFLRRVSGEGKGAEARLISMVERSGQVDALRDHTSQRVGKEWFVEVPGQAVDIESLLSSVDASNEMVHRTDLEMIRSMIPSESAAC